MPIFCHRVEHQNDSDPPSEFLLTSITTGIVHYLSGLTSATCCITSATDLHPSPRCTGNLLGPCFNTGPIHGLVPPVLSLFTLCRDFSHFPRGNSSLSVSMPYLALDASTTRSCCTTKQHYSAFRVRSWAVTSSGLPFQAVCMHIHNSRGITTGAASCSLAATTEIHVCFFSCP